MPLGHAFDSGEDETIPLVKAVAGGANSTSRNQYLTLICDGSRFIALRDDKDAKDVRRE